MSNLGAAPEAIEEVVESEGAEVVEACLPGVEDTVVLGAPKKEVMEALWVVLVFFEPGAAEEVRASAALRLSEDEAIIVRIAMLRWTLLMLN